MWQLNNSKFVHVRKMLYDCTIAFIEKQLNMEKPEMYYSDYLELNKLLDAQHPESYKIPNSPAHDEMLFIIVHQAYELWFKQILFELEFVRNVFKKEQIDDNSEDMNLVKHRLHRVVRILELLNIQVGLMDTMTPLDFLEFRNLLNPSSGFQSVQFRLVEATLGLSMEKRYENEYYKRTNEGGFRSAHLDQIKNTENEISILSLVNGWLERIPFFDNKFWQNENKDFNMHPFWKDYKERYFQSLGEKEKSNISDFDYIFFRINDGMPMEKINLLQTTLSPQAMRAALFIMLYRDFPVFQTSYQILDLLVEIDHQMAGWRHKHLVMVKRMIGLRVGTGNTSGSAYLEGALGKHYVFKDLSAISTFLIERKKLPKLPKDLIEKLSYNKV